MQNLGLSKDLIDTVSKISLGYEAPIEEKIEYTMNHVVKTTGNPDLDDVIFHATESKPLMNQADSIHKNMFRKKLKGTYDHERSKIGWGHFVANAFKAYKSANPGTRFTPEQKKKLATHLADGWHTQYKAHKNELNELVLTGAVLSGGTALVSGAIMAGNKMGRNREIRTAYKKSVAWHEAERGTKEKPEHWEEVGGRLHRVHMAPDERTGQMQKLFVRPDKDPMGSGGYLASKNNPLSTNAAQLHALVNKPEHAEGLEKVKTLMKTRSEFGRYKHKDAVREFHNHINAALSHHYNETGQRIGHQYAWKHGSEPTLELATKLADDLHKEVFPAGRKLTLGLPTVARAGDSRITIGGPSAGTVPVGQKPDKINEEDSMEDEHQEPQKSQTLPNGKKSVIKRLGFQSRQDRDSEMHQLHQHRDTGDFNERVAHMKQHGGDIHKHAKEHVELARESAASKGVHVSQRTINRTVKRTAAHLSRAVNPDGEVTYKTQNPLRFSKDGVTLRQAVVKRFRSDTD